MSSILSVSQLNKYVSFKIKSDLKLKGIAVKGEISNFTVHYKSGHAYFTVKDAESAVKAVMFSSNVQRLKFIPEDGMNVIVMGNLEVYERDGVYQIIVSEISPLGVGLVHNKIEMLKEKLKEQGVFATEKKQAIPLVPKKIAVVTSLTGAALQDILHITERRYPVCSVVIYPAQVQGMAAPKSICKALEQADNCGADTIILARGGGSTEDLMPFNSEDVTKEVYKCKTPVITAVGHETDTTLVDYAADMRAATPSAAAELATPDKTDILSAIELLKRKLDRSINDKLRLYELQVESLGAKMSQNSPEKKLDENSRKLENIRIMMDKQIRQLIQRQGIILDGYVSSLNALSPFNVLSRGYSMVECQGELVDSISKVKEKEFVEIKFSDGSATAEIKSITKSNFN